MRAVGFCFLLVSVIKLSAQMSDSDICFKKNYLNSFTEVSLTERKYKLRTKSLLKTEYPFIQDQHSGVNSDIYKPAAYTMKMFIAASPFLFAPDTRLDIDPNSIQAKIKRRSYISGALFIPTVGTGYWLSHSEKPPNTILLTSHKLFSVYNVVMMNVSVLQKGKETKLTFGEKVATISMNVCFVSTIGTGGLLSIDKKMPQSVHTLHNITPWLTIASSTLLMYLLNNNF